MGATSPVLNEELFWFGLDDGISEADNTFLGAKNSNQTLDVDTNYRYRPSVSNTGDKLANGVQLQLEYNYESGGWNPVDATSDVVRMAASTKLTEGNDCTERLAGAQAFDATNAGQEDNDGLTGANNLGIAAEIEGDFCFTIISGDVVDEETIVLRVTDAGTPLDNYNQTPTITVNEAGGTTFFQTNTGDLSFAGAIAKKGLKMLAGELTFAGVVAKLTKLSMSGGLSFLGSLIKKTFTAFAGGVSFIGDVAGIKKILQFVGGGLTFSGDITKKTLKIFDGGLTFSGTIFKKISKIFDGGLTFSGALAATRLFFKSLAGNLTFSGDITKKASKSINGILSFVGALRGKALKALGGALTLSGAITKKAKLGFSGAVSFNGALIKKTLLTMAGALTFTGNVLRVIKASVAGVLSFVGDLSTNFLPGGGGAFTKAVGGTITFSGNLRRSIIKSIAGTLSFVGVLSRIHINTWIILDLKERKIEFHLKNRLIVLSLKRDS